MTPRILFVLFLLTAGALASALTAGLLSLPLPN